MKQGRTPDRIHVVRPPQDDYQDNGPALTPLPPARPTSRGMEIVRTLAQISDKLKRSEAERYELLAELREYRKSLNELEDRAEKTEKAYQSLEGKMQSQGALDSDTAQRQARFERALKDTENKLVQAAAGQALLDQRLRVSEDNQNALSLRIDESVVQQARVDRQIDKFGQERARMIRKVERMEEILSETQDTLKARALVLLTDQSAAQNGIAKLPAYSDASEDTGSDAPWWRRSVRMQGVGMASMVIAALLFGWTINQVQQPDVPKIAVLENGGLAKLNLDKNSWEPITTAVAKPVTQSSNTTGPAGLAITPIAQDGPAPTAETENSESSASDQTPAANAALNASDDELMAALNEDPDGLAAQLNDIAPQADDTASVETAAISDEKNYNPLKEYGATAFAQNPAMAAKIAQEKSDAPLASRIEPDAKLPASIKKLEKDAFAGVGEAQHDLAAIYTAGRGGVTQNFEKAALWFREAADNGVSNAAYNLGVLAHQGLGMERDLDRAIYWYREAAKKNHPEAQYNLGIAAIEGIGTEYNAPLAAAFFESAANQGVTEAAYNLGLIYENGLLGDAGKGEDALLWYKISADAGNADAKAALQQLASSLEISAGDLDAKVKQLQSAYTAAYGRPPGSAKVKS